MNLHRSAPLRSGLAATRHPFGDGLREAEAERPSELPGTTRTIPALTRTFNHFKPSTKQQETPQSFNNGWDIPRIAAVNRRTGRSFGSPVPSRMSGLNPSLRKVWRKAPGFSSFSDSVSGWRRKISIRPASDSLARGNKSKLADPVRIKATGGSDWHRPPL